MFHKSTGKDKDMDVNVNGRGKTLNHLSAWSE